MAGTTAVSITYPSDLIRRKMPLTVPHLGLVFVLEMNNDQNKIMGIVV